MFKITTDDATAMKVGDTSGVWSKTQKTYQVF